MTAIALSEEGHDGKTYTITGPAAVTHTEMASALSKAIGRPVAFMDVPSDAFAGALKAAGVPPWQVDGLVEDHAHYARVVKPKRRCRMSVKSQALTRVTSADLPRTTHVPSSEPELRSGKSCCSTALASDGCLVRAAQPRDPTIDLGAEHQAIED